jgi:drug/metabolite transporter (DMT)-like permease
MKLNRAFIYIIIGASLWGTLGFYVNNLYTYGFTPMEVVTLRVWTAAIILVLFLLITSPKKLILQQATDIKYFIGTGIFSIIFFNYCLFTAMEISTIPIATALLYTGPIFVTIFSFFLFKEPLTKVKIIALFITLFGTSLVVGLIPFDGEVFKWGSIFFGIGSAIGYALYSIFSKFALVKYDSLTITTFTFVTAAIALTPFFPYQEKAELLIEPAVILYAFGLGLLPTAFAYIIYTYGLNKTEASKASILTTVEPVVATIIGIALFQEPFSFIQMLGMACIILAVIIIQLYSRPKKQVSERDVTTLKTGN